MELGTMRTQGIFSFQTGTHERKGKQTESLEIWEIWERERLPEKPSWEGGRNSALHWLKAAVVTLCHLTLPDSNTTNPLLNLNLNFR